MKLQAKWYPQTLESNICKSNCDYCNFRESYPSTGWRSINKTDYKSDYKEGPKAELPDVTRLDADRVNNPQGKHAYHFLGIGKQVSSAQLLASCQTISRITEENSNRIEVSLFPTCCMPGLSPRENML